MRLAVRLFWSHLLVLLLSLGIVIIILGGVTQHEAQKLQTFADRTMAQRMAPWIDMYYQTRGSWDGLQIFLSRLVSVSLYEQEHRRRMEHARRGHRQRSYSTEHSLLTRPLMLLRSNGTPILYVHTNQHIIHKPPLSAGIPVGNPPYAFLFVGSMAFSSEETPYKTITRQIIKAASPAALIALFAIVLIIVFWSRRLVRPMRVLAAAASQLGNVQEQVSVPIPRGKDEITQLATAFNAMSAQIRQQEQARKQFAADAAHEIRTPLALIAARLEMLQDGVYTPDASQWDALMQSVIRIQTLVTDLQTLARLDSGTFSIQPEHVIAAELIQAVCTSFAPAAVEKSITITQHIDAGAQTAAVMADPQRTTQIISNILSNAIRYSPPKGTIRVHLQIHTPVLTIAVDDEGIGISKADRQHVFERFVRLQQDRNRESGGSGLGLSIAAELVQKQGGTIGITDTEGKTGVRVWFTVPLA